MTQSANIQSLPALLSSDQKELLGADRPFSRLTLLGIGGKLAARIEKLPYVAYEIHHFIYLRNQNSRTYFENEMSFIGRLKNWFAGKEVQHYALLPGRILLAAYEYIGAEFPAELDHNQQYYLRLDYSENLFKAVDAKFTDKEPDLSGLLLVQNSDELALTAKQPVAEPA